MLIDLHERYRFINLVIAGLILYLFSHSLCFANLPESQFAVPKRELHSFYLDKAEIYLKEGKKELAFDRCQWVLTRTKDEEIMERSRSILNKINEKY